MAKGNNQKLKLSYLTRIMLEKTDDEHGLTMQQIIEELEKYGIDAERKSIYDDLRTFRRYLAGIPNSLHFPNGPCPEHSWSDSYT